MAAKPGSAEHMRQNAVFANAAYNLQNRMEGIPEGYMLDTELSNRNRAVYVNPELKKAVLAFRGTDLKSNSKYGDLGSDLLLAMNMRELSSRFRNATRAAQAVEAKYGDYEKHSIGHSLGASQASWVVRKRPKGSWQGTTYAAHLPTTSIPTEALNNLFWSRRNRQYLTNYAIAHDPVAAGNWLSGSTYRVKQTAGDPHSLGNYL